MHVDKVLVPDPRTSPHALDELAPGEHQPRPLRERGQDVELGPGEVDGRAGDLDLTCPDVDPEVSDDQNVRTPRARLLGGAWLASPT